MSGLAGLVLAPEARRYDHGPGHPLRPDRVLLTWELIAAYGLDRAQNVAVLPAEAADDDLLRLVHTDAFIDATRRAGHGEDGDWYRFGYGPGDNPIFPGMHEAGAIVAGASVAAARAVMEGATLHAFNAAGGLHHAMPGRASGFCVYDDPAIAIAWLLEHADVERIAYVDVDVHHGDGPQAIFYDEPRVLTASIHQYGFGFFPGTGSASERGAGMAEGTALNVPLAAGTGDDEWLAALRASVLPAVRSFGPDVLVTQLGCDTHRSDPLGQLELSTRAYAETAVALHELAHEVADGRWIATGGGGYQWARVVPRAWTRYFAEMAETPIPDALPASWVMLASERAGGPVPTTLSDPP